MTSDYDHDYGFDYDPYAEAGSHPPADRGAGAGRRRRAADRDDGESADGSAGFPVEPDYADYPARQAPYDLQWERSGLGWNQQEWAEHTRSDYAETEYRQRPYPDSDYADQDYADPVADQDYAEPGDPVSVDRDSFEEFEDIQGFGEADDAGQFARPAAGPARLGRRRSPAAEPRAVAEFGEDDGESALPAATGSSPGSPSASSTEKTAAASGAGAFGAAGIAVVTCIGAIVAAPILVIVVGLSQVGLAVGWSRTSARADSRRTTVLVALIGLTAAAIAYRAQVGQAAADAGSALGGGFVLLAADQLFRRHPDRIRRTAESLAAATTGAAFTVLPAGFVLAQREDAKLAGACALAAAVAVLCNALVGGGGSPVGALVGAAAATAVGAFSAVSLGAAAGAGGGAVGGMAAGLLAVAASRAADRLGAEGADVRVTAQVLPAAFAAIAAVIACLTLR